MGRQIQLLLDTHALYWTFLDDPQLSRTARKAIRDAGARVYVSPVSGLELAIKHRLGKLEAGDRLFGDYHASLLEQDFELLKVTSEHAVRAGLYPGHHRDPFDRLLAAQAELEDLTLVTRDPAFADFPCRTLW